MALDKNVDHALDPRSVIAGRLTGAILVASLSVPGPFGVVVAAIGTPWRPGTALQRSPLTHSV